MLIGIVLFGFSHAGHSSGPLFFIDAKDGSIKQNVAGKALPVMKFDILEMDGDDKSALGEVIISEKAGLRRLGMKEEGLVDFFSHDLPDDEPIGTSDFIAIDDITHMISSVEEHNQEADIGRCSDAGVTLALFLGNSSSSIESGQIDRSILTVGYTCSLNNKISNGLTLFDVLYRAVIPLSLADGFLDTGISGDKPESDKLNSSICKDATLLAMDSANKSVALGKVTKESIKPFVKIMAQNVDVMKKSGFRQSAEKIEKELVQMEKAVIKTGTFTREDHPKYLTKEEVSLLEAKKSMTEQAIKMEDHSFKERVVTIDRDGEVKHVEREITVDYSGQDYSPHLTPEFLTSRFKQEAVAAGVKLSDKNSDSLAETAMQVKIPLNIKSVVANSFKASREVSSAKKKDIKNDSKKASKSEWIVNRSKFIDKQIDRLESAYTNSSSPTRREELTKHIKSLKTKIGELDGELKSEKRADYKTADRVAGQGSSDSYSSKSPSSRLDIKNDSVHIDDREASAQSGNRGPIKRTGRALASSLGGGGQSKSEESIPITDGVLGSYDREDIIKKIMDVAVDFDPDVQRVANRERIDVKNGLQVDKSLFLDESSSGKNRIFSAFLIQLIDNELVDSFFIVDGVKKLKMIFYFNEDGSFGYRPEKKDTIFREIRGSSYIKILKDIK